jgi:hypothetical protein
LIINFDRFPYQSKISSGNSELKEKNYPQISSNLEKHYSYI